MIKRELKKKMIPLAMAVVLSATSMPVYMAQSSVVKAASTNTFGTDIRGLSGKWHNKWQTRSRNLGKR